jgi:hypothetical protein
VRVAKRIQLVDVRDMGLAAARVDRAQERPATPRRACPCSLLRNPAREIVYHMASAARVKLPSIGDADESLDGIQVEGAFDHS